MAKSKDALFDVAVLVRSVDRMKRSGEMVSISWKRGKLSGTTKTALSKWEDERITFECTFSRGDNDAFAEKSLLLVINEESDKKTRKLGRVEIDLARYAQQASDKPSATFEVSESVSRDLTGEEDGKKDKKDKGTAADGMKLSIAIAFTNKTPATDAAKVTSGHKASRSVDFGPLKIRKQQSSPQIVVKDMFTPPPSSMSPTSPSPSPSPSSSPMPPHALSSSDSLEKKEKKAKKEKKELRDSSEKREKKHHHSSSSRGDESDSDREKDKKGRDRASSRDETASNDKLLSTPTRRAAARSEMTLSSDDVRAAKLAIERGPIAAPSTSPTPPPMLGASPMKRPGHRKTSSMSVAMINSVMSMDAPLPMKSPKRGGPEVDSEAHSALKAQIEEDEGFLVENVIYFMDPLYSHGWPVPSYVIFRSLLQWRAFDVHTYILSHISDAIEKITQKLHVSQPYQAFWLASVSTLIYMLKKELQLTSASDLASSKSEFATFESKLTQSCTHLFITLVKACYAELDPIVSVAFLEQPDPMQQATMPKKPSATPETVVAVLTKYLDVLSSAHLFKSLITQFYRQILYYINGKLFNTLIERRNLCRCGNGIQIKMGVSVLQEWVHRQPALESIKDQLESIRQSADVLVVSKTKLLEGNVRREVCPALSHGQLHALLANYVPDEFDPESLDAKILQGLAQLAEQSIGVASINVNYTFPLSLNDLSVRKDFDFGSIEVPAAILARPGFAFLKDNSRLTDAGVNW